jgi:predicted nucleic acid-binding protein
MKERVFWDAWAFIALADRHYRHHQQARDVRLRLVEQRLPMITTEAVLSEVGNHFSQSPLREQAEIQLDAANFFVKNGTGLIVNVSHAIWQRAWELYRNRPDKDWGHTDCISFVVMSELGLTTAFTADEHFEQAGFTRLVKI